MSRVTKTVLEVVQAVKDANPKASTGQIKTLLAEEGYNVDMRNSNVKEIIGANPARQKQKKVDGAKLNGADPKRGDKLQAAIKVIRRSPKLSTQEIIDVVAEKHGFSISNHTVNKAKRRLAESASDQVVQSGNNMLTAAEFVGNVGGINNARHLIDSLEQVQEKMGT
jgi:hypothetical protein